MRIDRLHIERFGVWSDLQIPDLSSELTVFHGPNEAGKTTLLQFIRSVIYGFPRERVERYVWDSDDLEHKPYGGEISFDLHGTDYLVRRLVDPSNIHSVEGNLTVSRGDGAPILADQSLSELTHGIDESVFNNVFAIGLSELQYLATLNDTEAANQLYDLSTGLDRVSLAQTMHELTLVKQGLWDPNEESSSQIVKLVGEYREKQDQIDRLRERHQNWNVVIRELGHLSNDLARLNEQRAQLLAQTDLLETADRLRPAWEQRHRLDHDESMGNGAFEPIPERTLRKLNALGERIDQKRHRYRKLKQERKRLVAEAKDLSADPSLDHHQHQAQHLIGQETWINTLAEQTRQLEREVEELDFELQAEQEKLGVTGTTISVAGHGDRWRDDPLLNDAAERIREARRRLESAKLESSERRTEAAQIDEKLTAALHGSRTAGNGSVEEDLASAIEHTGDVASRLRRRVQAEEGAKHLAKRLGELKQQKQELLDRQVLSLPILILLGAIVTFGLMLFSLGILGPLWSYSTQQRFLFGLIGLLVSGAGAFAKVFLQNAADEQLEACDRQRDLVKRQMRQVRQEREELVTDADEDIESVKRQLQAAERRLRQLEKLLPFDAQQRASRDAASLAEQTVKSATAELNASHQAWREALRSRGYPENLTPDNFHGARSPSADLTGLRQTLQNRKRELEEKQRQLSPFVARLDELFVVFRITAQSSDTSERLRQLAQVLRSHEENTHQRNALRRRVRRLRREEKRIASTGRKLSQTRDRLFADVGALDEDDFRELTRQHEQSLNASREMNRLATELDQSLESLENRDQVVQLLQSGSDISTELADVRETLADVDGQIKNRSQRQAELNQQVRAVTDDRGLELAEFELGTIRTRLNEAFARWKVLSVTDQFLQQVYIDYENNRQPRTLRDASEYLRQLTNGRYQQIWTPLHERVLRVKDQSGDSLAIDSLSRGAREQVFLSLRLALASDYAERGIKIPMVLDDVLVNFDTERALAAARAVLEFSRQGHQVLLFTCHDHIRQLFEALAVDSRSLIEYREMSRGVPKSTSKASREPAQTPMQPAVLPAIAAIDVDLSQPEDQFTEQKEETQLPRSARLFEHEAHDEATSDGNLEDEELVGASEIESAEDWADEIEVEHEDQIWNQADEGGKVAVWDNEMIAYEPKDEQLEVDGQKDDVLEDETEDLEGSEIEDEGGSDEHDLEPAIANASDEEDVWDEDDEESDLESDNLMDEDDSANEDELEYEYEDELEEAEYEEDETASELEEDEVEEDELEEYEFEDEDEEWDESEEEDEYWDEEEDDERESRGDADAA